MDRTAHQTPIQEARTARGLFLTFEGSEGCGKSTQIRLLADSLKACGREVVLTREPGGTAIGDQIRHTLQYASESRGMTPEAELLLFAASRAQHVRELVRPALAAGKIVISDRFHDSTTVYQGIARKIDPAQVESINRFAVDGTLPDLTFLLDMDAAEAMRRVAGRERPDGHSDRMEEEPAAFYDAVRKGYLELARSGGARFRIIDASAAPDRIALQILAHLTPLLPPDGLQTR